MIRKGRESARSLRTMGNKAAPVWCLNPSVKSPKSSREPKASWTSRKRTPWNQWPIISTRTVSTTQQIQAMPPSKCQRDIRTRHWSLVIKLCLLKHIKLKATGIIDLSRRRIAVDAGSPLRFQIYLGRWPAQPRELAKIETSNFRIILVIAKPSALANWAYNILH